jgi:hypothetical protein
VVIIYKYYIDNILKDEGCKILNEILLENKKIEILNLSCKFLKKIIKTIKGNEITSNGLIYLKESLIKNQYLKKIDFDGIFLKINIR